MWAIEREWLVTDYLSRMELTVVNIIDKLQKNKFYFYAIY